MRKTRLAYHYTIRNARRHKHDIVNRRFAESILENKNRDFWGEVKRIRRSGSSCSSCIDGSTCFNDIADLFAKQYQDIYTSVQADMARIYEEIDAPLLHMIIDVLLLFQRLLTPCVS